MPDKNLTEAAWKSFAKSAGTPYKDDALKKAFAALEKSERADAAAQLAAIDDVEKQATLLRKSASKDTKLGDQLDVVEKALGKQRKAAEDLAKDEKRKAAESSGDEEEESPALLTTKMVPLLRAVRKGDTTLQALVAIAGKETAVLLSRKSISPTRGKLLKEYLGASGAIKFVRGECLFENNAHTFVVQSQAAGLAKKLRAALMQQTEMRVKVRVRGEDPDDIDDDGEEAVPDDAAAGTAGGDPRAEATPGGGGEVPPAPPPPEQVRFEARLAAMEPKLGQALQAQRGDVSKMRAVAGFAREKGEARLWADGLKALDALQKLLDAAASAPGTPEPTARSDGKPADPAAAFNARLAAMLPALKGATADGHPRANDAKLKLSEGGVMARKKDFEQANRLLDEAEALLASDAGSGSGDAGATPETASGDTPVDRSKAVKARLDALQPAIRAAMTGPLGAELKTLTSTLATEKGDLDAVDRTLDAIERLLARGAEAGTPPPVPPRDGPAAEWEGRVETVGARLEALLKRNPADATRLRGAMALATERAEGGRHADALAILGRLEELMSQSEDQLGGPVPTRDETQPAEGVVAYRRALVQFRTASSAVAGQLAALKSAIPQALPDESALADQIAAELQELTDELQDAVDEAMNAAANASTPVPKDVADALAAFRTRLDESDLVRHVDGNPFVKVSVAQTLGDALARIADAMPEPV